MEPYLLLNSCMMPSPGPVLKGEGSSGYVFNWQYQGHGLDDDIAGLLLLALACGSC